jgi:hypothetical protein
LIYAALTVPLTVAWCWICRIHGARPKLIPGYAVWARTQIAKYLPGNVMHYVWRQALGRRIGVGHSALAAASVVEMLSLLNVAILIGLIGTVGRTGLGLLNSPGVLAGIIVADFLALPLLDRVLRAIPLTARRMRALPKLSIMGMLRVMIPAMVLHAVFLLGTGLMMVGMLRLGWPDNQARMGQVVWVYALGWMAGVLTIGAPGGLGVREAVLSWALSPFIGPAGAGVFAIALRLVTLVGDALTALIGSLIRIPEPGTGDETNEAGAGLAKHN